MNDKNPVKNEIIHEKRIALLIKEVDAIIEFDKFVTAINNPIYYDVFILSSWGIIESIRKDINENEYLQTPKTIAAYTYILINWEAYIFYAGNGDNIKYKENITDCNINLIFNLFKIIMMEEFGIQLSVLNAKKYDDIMNSYKDLLQHIMKYYFYRHSNKFTIDYKIHINNKHPIINDFSINAHEFDGLYYFFETIYKLASYHWSDIKLNRLYTPKPPEEPPFIAIPLVKFR